MNRETKSVPFPLPLERAEFPPLSLAIRRMMAKLGCERKQLDGRFGRLSGTVQAASSPPSFFPPPAPFPFDVAKVLDGTSKYLDFRKSPFSLSNFFFLFSSAAHWLRRKKAASPGRGREILLLSLLPSSSPPPPLRVAPENPRLTLPAARRRADARGFGGRPCCSTPFSPFSPFPSSFFPKRRRDLRPAQPWQSRCRRGRSGGRHLFSFLFSTRLNRNVFHVTEEYEVERHPAATKPADDIVLFFLSSLDRVQADGT